MSSSAIVGATLLVLVAASAPVVAGPAEPSAAGAAPLRVQAYTLTHQAAEEAVQLVFPLLSDRGAVELQPGGNTLVIRDRPDRVERILTVLRDFDHPSSPLRLEIQIVRAGVAEETDGNQESLSPALVSRLKELLRYDSYRLLAGTRLVVREGEEVSYRLGDEFGVGFRPGTLLADGRVKLHGFRILRDLGQPDERQLIHTNLNLWLGKPMILGLAKAESSERALMVVLTCDLEEADD